MHQVANKGAFGLQMSCCDAPVDRTSALQMGLFVVVKMQTQLLALTLGILPVITQHSCNNIRLQIVSTHAFK